MGLRKKNIIIGIIALLLGLLSLMMFGFEVRDGVLQGSRSRGMTQANNPIGFYVSIVCECLVGLALSAFGVYSIRRKD